MNPRFQSNYAHPGNVLDTISHANDDYGQIIHSHEPLVTAAEKRSARVNPSAVALGGAVGLALAAWSLLRS